MEAPLKYAIQIVVYSKALSLDPFFSLYINDNSDNIKSSISLFADDTTLYFSSKFPKHLHLVLSEDLLTLGKWSDT